MENGYRNRRKVIYVPLDGQIRDEKLISILTGAKSFIDNLTIYEGQTLIVLFGLERAVSRSFGIILQRRYKYGKKLNQATKQTL